MKKGLELILLGLLAFMFLSGCCMNCCPTCSPTPSTCTLKIIPAPPEGWGWVVVDGMRTDHYVDYNCSCCLDDYSASGINCKPSITLTLECGPHIIQLEDPCCQDPCQCQPALRSILYPVNLTGYNEIKIDYFFDPSKGITREIRKRPFEN
jgi:hypothetical protein